MTEARKWEFRIVAAVAIVVVLAISAGFANLALAQSPEPEKASTWRTFEQAQEAFDGEIKQFSQELQGATSKEEVTGLYGELLARSIDHAVWTAAGIVWDDCYRDYANARLDQIMWLVAFVGAEYQQLTATSGEPVQDRETLQSVFGLFSRISNQARLGVSCQTNP